MSQFVQVTTAVGDREGAERISERLVKERLAGCAQIIGPIESTYRWKGEIESAEEWLCLIKSEKDLYGEQEREIEKMHPYKTPEIICTPIRQGSEKYLEWWERN